MKKTKIGIAVLILAFTSCKKQDNGTGWNCTCVYNYYGQKTYTLELPKQSKSSAEKQCAEKQMYYQSISGASGAICSL